MKNHRELIHEILKENKGFITADHAAKAEIPRRCLSDMTKAGVLYKVDRGIYSLSDAWEDDFYFLQYRFSKGIFSHETALYIHNMTDRTPISYTMTFPAGYNTGNVRSQRVTAKLATMHNYDLGIIDLMSPSGNPLKVYDIERTLCDIVKIKHGGDIQVINQAMKMYAGSKSRDIAKLIGYAERLRVKSKILTYMEVLL